MDCPGLGAGCGLGTIPAIDEAILAGQANTSGTGSNWSWLQNIVGGAVGTVEDILKSRNVVRGVLTQTSPGVFQYVQPEGSGVTLPVGVSPVGSLSAAGSSGMGMILLAGAGIFLVFMLAKGKG